jgi:outer membrane lipoprotein SlyB
LDNTATGKPRPLVLGAAVSVIIVSLLGAVAISGLLSGAHSEKSEASAPKNRMTSELTIPLRDSDSVCASCGTVEAVRVVEVRGNIAPTILGAAGGALDGSEIEKNVQKRVSYRVTVRMDDGSFRTVSQPTVPSVAVGDRVRIANGALAARS